MDLYLTVFERDDTSPDWFLWTSKAYPTDAQELNKINKHLKDNDDESDINDYWTNKINMVDGYKIKLEKDN